MLRSSARLEALLPVPSCAGAGAPPLLQGFSKPGLASSPFGPSRLGVLLAALAAAKPGASVTSRSLCQCGAILPVSAFAKMDLASTPRRFARPEFPTLPCGCSRPPTTSVMGHVQLDSTPFLHSMFCMDFPPPVLDFLHLGTVLLSRSFTKMGSPLIVFGQGRPGSSASAFDAVAPGATLAIRGALKQTSLDVAGSGVLGGYFPVA
ncbi:unnamed protein product, partial [Symbiodinium natans]